MSYCDIYRTAVKSFQHRLVGAMVARAPPKGKVAGSSPVLVELAFFLHFLAIPEARFIAERSRGVVLLKVEFVGLVVDGYAGQDKEGVQKTWAPHQLPNSSHNDF